MSNCIRKPQGGKGNRGMFVERNPKVCAAGKPTAQALVHVADVFNCYKLQEGVDALIHDAIIPAPKVPPVLSSKQEDKRNTGLFTQVRELINPIPKTNFQLLVEDFKNTSYASYWKKQVGRTRDQVPMLPEGLDIVTTTMGQKTKFCGNLYDIAMPNDRIRGNTSTSKYPSEMHRNYCRPNFDPNQIFGMTYKPDKRGTHAKCCLSDDRILLGTDRATPINMIQADFKETIDVRLGKSTSTNNNISSVPSGFAFGCLKPPDSIPENLSRCTRNTEKDFFMKCLGHLNTVRKCLSKRYDSLFFGRFYKNLKYLDKSNTGWLPKQDIYNLCSVEFIKFNSSLIEPLLEMWNAFDGSQIEYKTFVRVINYREPSPTLPKILDISEACFEFSTTYNDMVEPGQKVDKKPRAGLPSGRYIDKDYPVIPIDYCKADTVYLPEESDARVCLNPSVFTILGINHRDMYAKRTPEQIEKVFKAAGARFTDEKFKEIWNEAKKYHSQEWVCYETFKRALHKLYGEENLLGIEA